MIKTLNIETPLGILTAGATKEGVCLLEYADRQSLNAEIEELKKLLSTDAEPGENRYIRMVKKQLKDYFRGKRKEFTCNLIVPGTGFQKEVWEKLRTIRYGTTISYMELARLINKPEAVRAVANAVGSNRIAIIIPCHRVIGSDGSLTGYGGGLQRKSRLIEHEKKYSGKPIEGTLF